MQKWLFVQGKSEGDVVDRVGPRSRVILNDQGKSRSWRQGFYRNTVESVTIGADFESSFIEDFARDRRITLPVG